MTPAILAALLRLPAYHAGPADTAQLAVVAEAIAVASTTREEAAALVSLGWHESRYAAYVIEGRCLDGPRGARCDVDRLRVLAGECAALACWCTGLRGEVYELAAAATTAYRLGEVGPMVLRDSWDAAGDAAAAAWAAARTAARDAEARAVALLTEAT